MFKHIRKELLLLAGAIATALFAANDALDLFGSGPEYDRWVFLIALLLLLGTMFWRVLKLRIRIDEYENKVTVTASLAEITSGLPDPDTGSISVEYGVIWEVWSAEDVSVDRLALNLIHEFGKGWWQIWKKRKRAITGIPPNGESTYYRKRYDASNDQPNTDSADFPYLPDEDSNRDAHWLIELVLITAVPKSEHRIPVSIDWDELRRRGSNPPL